MFVFETRISFQQLPKDGYSIARFWLNWIWRIIWTNYLVLCVQYQKTKKLVKRTKKNPYNRITSFVKFHFYCMYIWLCHNICLFNIWSVKGQSNRFANFFEQWNWVKLNFIWARSVTILYGHDYEIMFMLCAHSSIIPVFVIIYRVFLK